MQKIFIQHLTLLKGDMTVTAFARFLEMPQNTLDCYLKGNRKPSVELLTRVCAKCHVSADWLLGLSNVRERIEDGAPNRNVIEMSFNSPQNGGGEKATVRQ